MAQRAYGRYFRAQSSVCWIKYSVLDPWVKLVLMGEEIRDMTELLKTPGRLRGKTPRTARQQLRQVEVSRHQYQSVAFSLR